MGQDAAETGSLSHPLKVGTRVTGRSLHTASPPNHSHSLPHRRSLASNRSPIPTRLSLRPLPHLFEKGAFPAGHAVNTLSSGQQRYQMQRQYQELEDVILYHLKRLEFYGRDELVKFATGCGERQQLPNFIAESFFLAISNQINNQIIFIFKLFKHPEEVLRVSHFNAIHAMKNIPILKTNF